MQYWHSRFLFERSLALIYLVAFAVAANQFVPLSGEHGLLPISDVVQFASFRESPSLFFLSPTDTAFRVAAWTGIALSLLALSAWPQRRGTIAAAVVWGALWLLYLSFVNVGQTFYGFGWETLLLEAGFLAIFLGGSTSTPSPWLGWMYRWVLFRMMFGAGLIKLRGDPCWRDLTCLNYYFETQPMPNPLSWYFHWLPEVVHKAGVAINHVVELIVPFGLFAPQPIAGIAALITIGLPGRAHRQRQPVVVQLAHPHSLHPRARRAISLVAAGQAAGAAAAARHAPRRPLRARHRDRCPQHRAGEEHALVVAADEHVVRAAPPGEHVRRVRQHHAHAVRDRHRGHRRCRR